MEFKDIVNRDLVNLENCVDEPIHIPGTIQPFGFLLALKAPDLLIDFCSANTFDFCGLTYEQLLGKSFEEVFGAEQASAVKRYVLAHENIPGAPLALALMNKVFTCTIQVSPDQYLLEFEQQQEGKLQVADLYNQAKQLAVYMQSAGTLKMLCQSVADETRAITGYDRVMIYKFDENYNGGVIAESRCESVEPFIGLHYPHTDIPAQARELYLTNLFRVITDVNDKPVPIYTIADLPGKNLDLSMSVLRSVSPIHIQYLKNMGVGATMSVSLKHHDKLWGLIVCHHYSPMYLTSDVRVAAQLQAHFLSSQISVREVAEEYELAKKINSSLDELVSLIFSGDDIPIDSLIHQKELLTICNASSVIVVLNDEIYSQGNVPAEAEIRKLINWLHTYNSRTGFSTSNLSLLYPDAKKWCTALSGIIYYSLGANINDCIIWCRPELLEDVTWAGKPTKPQTREERLTPRTSFASWAEVKKCEGQKWQKPELVATASFVNAFQRYVYLVYLTKEERKQRQLNEKLREANVELENMYWIGSHDLKEPLRKIQMFASKIISDESAGNFDMIFHSVKRMNDSAQRMQLLISDILSYSRLSHVDEKLTMVSLNEVVTSVLEELYDEISALDAVKISYGDLPDVSGATFFLNQLFVNLLRNSLKFTRPGVPPQVSINYEGETFLPESGDPEQLFYKIVVADNGIGFDEKFKESIFKVFTRLHAQSSYGGSGVGLALCRKIMTNHKGYITAGSVPGVGAEFMLYFPR